MNVDMGDVSVMIGIPAGRDFHPHTVKSLLGTVSACTARGVHCEFGMVVGSSIVQWARDEVIDQFLSTKANRLFWIDSDMVWEPGQFLRLLVFSKLRDVVAAAYPAKKDQPTFYVSHAGMERDEYGLCPVLGLGLGFTVMTREVVEKLVAKAPKVIDDITGREMASVFRIDTKDGNRRGEDMAFFSDIRDLGYKVYLDPSIDLGHIGQKVYRGSMSEGMQ